MADSTGTSSSDPAVAQPAVEERQLGSRPIDIRSIAITGLFLLALLYTLHFARSFLIPVVLAVLLDFLLSPVIRAMKKVRIPEPASAAIVLLTLLIVLGGGVYSLTEPAKEWISKAPASISKAEAKLKRLRGPVEDVTKTAERVEEMTDVDRAGAQAPEVQIKGPSLSEQVFGGTTSFLGGLTVVIFLLYLLLAAGDLFLQKMIKVLPLLRDKKRAVAIVRETEVQISAYLSAFTVINIGVGIVTGFAMFVVGMPNPILWGVIAGLLNFIPYVGALVNVVILGLAAMVQFEDTSRILLVPGVFLAINLLEGNIITPMILGKRLTLNPVAVFVGLIFWWYLWGIPGALLAVPMVATLKIFCDHIESLAPVGEFLGR